MALTALDSHRHGVVFYEDDHKFNCEAIQDFCLRALRAGDPLVVIASRRHLDQLSAALLGHGFNWEAAQVAGRAAEHDADRLLEQFCSPTGLDPFRFRAAMEEVLAPWADIEEGRTVRVFGEMVDLLCQRGDLTGAAQLEEMWNELARSHRFTLLCAYSMRNLYREVNGSPYRRIVDAHDHLVSASTASGSESGAAAQLMP